MMGLILQRAFFAREARVVAPALLGKLLCVRGADGVVRRGRLMEVEAYLPEGDLAAHGARGFTTAKASLFGEAGHLYVHPMR